MISYIAATLPELPPVVQQQQPTRTRQQEILDKIMQQAPAVATERSFGECTYQWSQWKLSKDGVRTTLRTCKGESVQTPGLIAVSCAALQVNTSEAGKWTGWRSPIAKGAKPGEAQMVAALCANVSQ